MQRRIFTAFLLVACLKAIAAADLAPGGAARQMLAAAPSPSNADCCTLQQQLGFSSNLPVMIVKSAAAAITRDKVNDMVQACVCPNGLPKAAFNNNASMHVRGGQTSQSRNTIVSYSLKTDSNSFLGLPKAKKWMLYGPQNDTLGLHDFVGMAMSNALGYYAPHTQYFELFVFNNGATSSATAGDAYQGVYLLEEKITQGSHRVNISNLSDHPGDVSGGFLLEFEHGTGMQWNIYQPTPEEITPQAVAYVHQYFNNFEGALFGSAFTDPVQGWRQFANDTSFVDWFLIQEIVKNPKHGYRGTSFTWKEAGQKLNMGPIWRVLQGFGQCCGFPVTGYQAGGASNGSSGGSAISPEGWLFNICLDPGRCVSDDGHALLPQADWFVRLMQDPGFRGDAASTYAHMRKGAWSDTAIRALLGSAQKQLAQPGRRTFNKWPALLLAPYGYPDADTAFTSTFSTLQQWLLARLAWLDTAFDGPIALPSAQAPAAQIPQLSAAG